MSTMPIWQSADHTIRVFVGEDPGGFYCEHAFWAARHAAIAAASTVVVVDGEPLVGFLHVPHDDACDVDAVVADRLARHAGTIAVVAAAIDGLRDLADGVHGFDNHEPVRVLLTGFRPWGSIKNNPSGELVANDDTLAAIRQRLHSDHDLSTQLLDVDDRAIDGGSASIQSAIARTRPHVVLSLGVHSTSDVHHAERLSSDKNLVKAGAGWQRVADRPATTHLPPNDHLVRVLSARSAARHRLG